MSDERLEAAAKELRAVMGEVLGCWEDEAEHQRQWVGYARAVLAVADAASGEKVVWRNPYNKPITVQVDSLDEVVSLVSVTVEVPDGHELVVRKAGE